MGMTASIVGGYGAVVSQGDMGDEEFEEFWDRYLQSIYHYDYTDTLFFCMNDYYSWKGESLSELVSEVKKVGEKVKDKTDEELKKFVEQGGEIIQKADYYVFPYFG